MIQTNKLSVKKGSLAFIDKKDLILLSIIFVITLPFLFYFKIKYDFPPGYAGFQAQISEVLQTTDFKFPDFIPYYGSGGFPFAYPPLAFYIMAIAMKVFGIGLFSYLKYAPNFFLLLTFIFFYLLSKRLLGSRIKAFIATLFLASSSGVIGYHYPSEGVTRGLAFLFLVASLFFLSEGIHKRRHFILSAVVWGLCALTHPVYAVIGSLSAFVFIVFLYDKHISKKISLFINYFFIGFLIIGPWLFIVISRHGLTPLTSAFSTHGTVSFITHLTNFENFYKLFESVIIPSHETVVLTGLSLAGVVYYLLRADIFLPFWFVSTAVLGGMEGQRFVALVASLVSADMLVRIINPKGIQTGKRIVKVVCLTVVLVISVVYITNRMTKITAYKPYMDNESIKGLGDWFMDNAKDSNYLLLSVSEGEHEWMPYFIKANPVVLPFGAEWKGDYAQQGVMLQKVMSCAREKNLMCYKNLAIDTGLKYDYLIIRDDYKTLGISADNNFKLVFEDSSYSVWEN